MRDTTIAHDDPHAAPGDLVESNDTRPLWERIAAVLIVGFLATAFFGTFALAARSRPELSSTAVEAAGAHADQPAHADRQFDPSDVGSAVAAHYEHAAAHPDVYEAVPCYCGCDTFADHAHLLDCFVRPADGAWDAHAAYCVICREEAIVVQELLDDGRSTPDIRAEIIDRFGPTTSPGAA